MHPDPNLIKKSVLIWPNGDNAPWGATVCGFDDRETGQWVIVIDSDRRMYSVDPCCITVVDEIMVRIRKEKLMVGEYGHA